MAYCRDSCCFDHVLQAAAVRKKIWSEKLIKSPRKIDFNWKFVENNRKEYDFLETPKFFNLPKIFDEKSDLVQILNRNLLDLEQKPDRNLKEILEIFVQIRCAFSAQLWGNCVCFEVMMPKKCCTDLNQIWSRNLKYFEQKSERNLCKIFKICSPPSKILIQILNRFETEIC